MNIRQANIEGLKAGVSGLQCDNPYIAGSEEHESWNEGYKSGCCLCEYPVSSDMRRIWNE